MTAQSIAVCGLGRCGSSLVMQMLAAGGVPCTGRFPAFEGRQVAGHAFKVLDPQSPHVTMPEWANTVIWIDRNPNEQAKSHVKFTALVADQPYSREARRKLPESLKRDRSAAMAMLAWWHHNLLVLSFEDVLADPFGYAVRIGSFVQGPFDTEAAQLAVVRRPAGCRPDLALEFALMRNGPLKPGILEGRTSQHVLKAEAATPDATDRENAAATSPVGGPMGTEQPAAAVLTGDDPPCRTG